jgi:hypothetical protein
MSEDMSARAVNQPMPHNDQVQVFRRRLSEDQSGRFSMGKSYRESSIGYQSLEFGRSRNLENYVSDGGYPIGRV